MSFASEQLARLEAIIAANPGVKSVNVDGQQVGFDDLMAQRNDFKREVARESGRRPSVSSINLGNAF